MPPEASAATWHGPKAGKTSASRSLDTQWVKMLHKRPTLRPGPPTGRPLRQRPSRAGGGAQDLRSEGSRPLGSEQRGWRLGKGPDWAHLRSPLLHLLFVAVVVFSGPHPRHVEVPRQGVNRSCSCQPTPQPQQFGI